MFFRFCLFDSRCAQYRGQTFYNDAFCFLSLRIGLQDLKVVTLGHTDINTCPMKTPFFGLYFEALNPHFSTSAEPPQWSVTYPRGPTLTFVGKSSTWIQNSWLRPAFAKMLCQRCQLGYRMLEWSCPELSFPLLHCRELTSYHYLPVTENVMSFSPSTTYSHLIIGLTFMINRFGPSVKWARMISSE